MSEELYYDSMGVILSAEQPLDDSKLQAPFAQQEAFFGVSGATLTGELQQKWGDNPGIAISNIKRKMYDIASKQLSERIGKTKLPVEVSVLILVLSTGHVMILNSIMVISLIGLLLSMTGM